MMFGELPTSLKIGEKSYPIRTDFRDVLRIIAAFNADELSMQEKIYVCFRQLFKHPEELEDLEAAYKAAMQFISCSDSEDEKPKPQLVDWEKDEQLIFAAVNKVSGMEVRAVPYMHWWTFLGFFQNIDGDGVWATVLAIRQKKAKHKKLEKWEQEFFNANRDMCTIGKIKNTKNTREAAYDALDAFYYELLQEEKENGESSDK